MQITSKGQVTIPQEIRIRLGLLPHTEVEFELADDHARIRKVRHGSRESNRGRLAVGALRGTSDVRMSTDEIMALTRGEASPGGGAGEGGDT
jgi:AbrB family looped-hinge helix DNA binding protein